MTRGARQTEGALPEIFRANVGPLHRFAVPLPRTLFGGGKSCANVAAFADVRSHFRFEESSVSAKCCSSRGAGRGADSCPLFDIVNQRRTCTLIPPPREAWEVAWREEVAWRKGPLHRFAVPLPHASRGGGIIKRVMSINTYTDEFHPVPPCFSTWGSSLASRKAIGHGVFPHARACSKNASPCYSPC